MCWSDVAKMSLYFWPPKKADGWSSAEPWKPALAAGHPYAPWMSKLTLCGSVLSQTANCIASLTCLEPLRTAVDEPPQLAEAWPPALHCGIGATRHLPAV